SQSRQSYGDSDRQPYSSQSRQSYGYDDSEPYYYDNTAQKPEKKSPNWLFPVLLVVCVLLLGVIVYQIVDLIRIKADASEVNVPNVSIKGDNAEEETDEDTVVAASSQEE
ncbi:MAG: hypothetical protein Q4B22_12150, partial [Eubacteriales bacterium]|nr:hypothetical protein [Eubacteriales bacterium]